MSWIWRQRDGLVLDPEGYPAGDGYSGGNCGKNPEGKNNPDMQAVHNVGPIPRGTYLIQAPQNTVTHGPYVLPLLANLENQMFGRYGFLIHGDSIVEPGTASQGCVILPRALRERIWQSNDHVLKVVELRQGE